MRRLGAVARRELAALFRSPAAYVVLAVFFAISGAIFSNVIGYYSLVSAESLQSAEGTSPDVNFLEGLIRPYFTNVAVVLLFLLPMISMRLFSEELRSGTFELLFSYPVRDAEAVVGKFLASAAFLGALLAAPLLHVALAASVARPDWGPILTGLFGLILLGCAFLALGLFFSTWTSSGLLAAVATFGALLGFMLLEWGAQSVGPRGAAILTRLSLMARFESFSKGVLDLSDVAYFVAFPVFFLYAASRTLELRRVRGL